MDGPSKVNSAHFTKVPVYKGAVGQGLGEATGFKAVLWVGVQQTRN